MDPCQSGQALGHATPVAQTPEHAQALPELGFCQIEIPLMLIKISQAVNKTSHITAVIGCTQEVAAFLVIIPSPVILSLDPGYLTQVV